jgi:catechol 2,3-dioxygenase-like lactoylglutathione lyase family enzyme
MRIIKLAWVGTRTDNAEPTVAFFREVLSLRLESNQPGFWMLKLPDGSKVEVFGPDSPINRHFTTGPVAGFLVDDVHGAAAELRSGVEILRESGLDDSGNAWVHFRAPDGNIHELTQDPGVQTTLGFVADPGGWDPPHGSVHARSMAGLARRLRQGGSGRSGRRRSRLGPGLEAAASSGSASRGF